MFLLTNVKTSLSREEGSRKANEAYKHLIWPAQEIDNNLPYKDNVTSTLLTPELSSVIIRKEWDMSHFTK